MSKYWKCLCYILIMGNSLKNVHIVVLAEYTRNFNTFFQFIKFQLTFSTLFGCYNNNIKRKLFFCKNLILLKCLSHFRVMSLTSTMLIPCSIFATNKIRNYRFPEKCKEKLKRY